MNCGKSFAVPRALNVSPDTVFCTGRRELIEAV